MTKFDWQAEHHWTLYRIFDAADVLLYVGISTQVEKRLKAHASWMKNHEGAYVLFEPIGTMTYDAAQRIEGDAINSDPPPAMNKVHSLAHMEQNEREHEERYQAHKRALAAYLDSDEYHTKARAAVEAMS